MILTIYIYSPVFPVTHRSLPPASRFPRKTKTPPCQPCHVQVGDATATVHVGQGRPFLVAGHEILFHLRLQPRWNPLDGIFTIPRLFRLN